MSSTICLDSDFIIMFLRGELDAKEKLQELIDNNEEISTTSINTFEIFVGIIAIEGIGSRRIRSTRQFLDLLTVFDFSKSSSERAAGIYNTLKNAGTPIGLKDTLIASIAMEENLTILTRNLKHYSKIAGLKIETW